MPISTDSDAWQEGEDPVTTEFAVLDFLKENAGKAYNIREIADEIVDTDWAKYEEQHRKQDQLADGERLDEEEREFHPFSAYYRETALLGMIIRPLVQNGLIESRYVDASESGPEVPDEWEEVLVYSYYEE